MAKKLSKLDFANKIRKAQLSKLLNALAFFKILFLNSLCKF